MEKTLIMFTLLVVCVLFVVNVTAADSGKELIDKDSWYRRPLFIGEGIEITFNVSVQRGGEIDLYIITASEFIKYEKNETFDPVVEFERIINASGTYELPDDQLYFFVIDNWNNENTDDANPDDEVYVDYYIDFDTKSDEKLLNLAIYYCSLIALIVVVVIVIALLIFRRQDPPSKKGKKISLMAPPPPQYYPPPHSSINYQENKPLLINQKGLSEEPKRKE